MFRSRDGFQGGCTAMPTFPCCQCHGLPDSLKVPPRQAWQMACRLCYRLPDTLQWHALPCCQISLIKT